MIDNDKEVLEKSLKVLDKILETQTKEEILEELKKYFTQKIKI